MQASLELKTQRAEEYEKKYAEAQETIEIIKSEETERKVLQVHDYNCFNSPNFVAYMYTVDNIYC